ncbi:MAG: putative toxin-antitoxin system toxin component, PIN family [Chloroflexi bacterium]|nr:putative toxin-antitoxin system toxin component, PIN family [Chloroflexota bacterium]
MHAVAVIDTSVWVSAFLNPAGFPARLVALGKKGGFDVVTSLPLLAELAEVLCRPRIKKVRDTTDSDADAFVRTIAGLAHVVPVTGELRLCRDPDDDIVLETAIEGGATHVVSRDEDITRDLDLQAQLITSGIKVVTISHFLEELQS